MSERQSAENDACRNCGEPIALTPDGWIHPGLVAHDADGVACELVFVAEPTRVTPPEVSER